MLLVLDDNHKAHLAIVKNLDTQVITEFCRLSIDFIRRGINSKMYQAAAQKLEIESEKVQQAIEGLMNLFSESARLMLSEIDFHDSVMTLGLSEDIAKELTNFYTENKTDIRHLLLEMELNATHYGDLEWRLEIKLGSRSLRHETEPIILLKIHTNQAGKVKVTTLRTDPVNLIHLTQNLEEALQEMKLSHCRRIVRNI